MLVCFHDYTSPASLVAVLRLQPLVDEGLPVRFEGLDVLGVEVALPVTLDVLAQLEQHAGEAAELGITPRRPDRQPPTIGAHVVADLADDAGLGSAWRLAAYRAYWEDGTDLGDGTALVDLAAGVGLEADRVAAALADRSLRAELRRRMTARRSDGVGGVPVLLAGRTYVPALLPEAELRALAALG